jgi:hypothetical protein
MGPELSHRVAQAMMWGLPDLLTRRRLRTAVVTATTIDDLPADLRQWVLDAEAAHAAAVADLP